MPTHSLQGHPLTTRANSSSLPFPAWQNSITGVLESSRCSLWTLYEVRMACYCPPSTPTLTVRLAGDKVCAGSALTRRSSHADSVLCSTRPEPALARSRSTSRWVRSCTLSSKLSLLTHFTPIVCARHSRSGRKPYEKKHPERQRRVPSRKVRRHLTLQAQTDADCFCFQQVGGEGCPAVITYRTFDDRDQVDVECTWSTRPSG